MASLRRRNVKTRNAANYKQTVTNTIELEESKEMKSMSDLELEQCEQLKQMFTFVWRYKWIFFILLVATMGHVITRMLFPIVIGFAITTLTAHKDKEIAISDGIMSFLCDHSILNCSKKLDLLNTTVYLMIYVNIGQTIFNFVRGYYGKLLSLQISSNIANTLFHNILCNDLSFFECDENGKSGILLNRLGADCSKFASFCSDFIPGIMDNIFGITFGLIYVFYVSLHLTLIMLFFVLISSISSRYFSNYFAALASRLQTISANCTNIATESIQNIKTIKSFSSESQQELLYAKEISKRYVSATNISFYRAICEGIVTVLTFISIGCVILYASKMYLHKHINSGDMVSFIISSIQISKFMQRVLGKYGDLMTCLGATKRIFILMNKERNISAIGGGGDIERNEKFRGKIEFKNVCFCYPDRNIQIVNNLSFCINGGEMIGIVGESGCGKSTIINLLMRFYDPSSGNIFIDDINLKSYNLIKLHRNNIGYVEQEPLLFNKSIKWNICYGADINDKKMIAAAKKAECYSFIMQLKNGFDTICGERGSLQSGGQKQRIAIARAIYNNPHILIFDEASSALDAKNEHVIYSNFLCKNDNQNDNKKKTIIIIAHRLSTIKNCDKIFVIKNNNMAQNGTHKQLKEIKDGEYFKLLQKQMFTVL